VNGGQSKVIKLVSTFLVKTVSLYLCHESWFY